MRSYGIYSKVVLNGLVCDRFIPRLIRLLVSIIWSKAELLSISRGPGLDLYAHNLGEDNSTVIE